MKAHKKYIEAINLKLDGRLSGDEDRRLAEHLRACDACRAEYEALLRIRRNLLAVVDVPLDAETAERNIAKIMAAIRERGDSKRSTSKRSALKPALGFAALVVLFLASVAILHQPEDARDGLYSNPDDLEFDSRLVEMLNEHELICALEVFSQPLVIAGEREVNDSLFSEMVE